MLDPANEIDHEVHKIVEFDSSHWMDCLPAKKASKLTCVDYVQVIGKYFWIDLFYLTKR